VTLKNGATYSG
jgi:hypothetical protein